MIYVADGPSDVPCFSVVKGQGGRTYAVHHPTRRDEFVQNDKLRQVGRIDHYGPADFTTNSPTMRWLTLHIHDICDRIVADREAAVAQRVARPPRHLGHEKPEKPAERTPIQESFL
jgi:hypothetical protein